MTTLCRLPWPVGDFSVAGPIARLIVWPLCAPGGVILNVTLFFEMSATSPTDSIVNATESSAFE